MEELKSRKAKLLSDLPCIGENDLKNLEAKAAIMPETQKKVQERQEQIANEQSSAAEKRTSLHAKHAEKKALAADQNTDTPRQKAARKEETLSNYCKFAQNHVESAGSLGYNNLKQIPPADDT